MNILKKEITPVKVIIGSFYSGTKEIHNDKKGLIEYGIIKDDIRRFRKILVNPIKLNKIFRIKNELWYEIGIKNYIFCNSILKLCQEICNTLYSCVSPGKLKRYLKIIINEYRKLILLEPIEIHNFEENYHWKHPSFKRWFISENSEISKFWDNLTIDEKERFLKIILPEENCHLYIQELKEISWYELHKASIHTIKKKLLSKGICPTGHYTEYNKGTILKNYKEYKTFTCKRCGFQFTLREIFT
jgi:hypothetical protein